MAKISIWQRIINFFTGKKQPAHEPAQVKDGIWYAKQADGSYLLGIDKSVYDLMGKITFADFPTNWIPFKSTMISWTLKVTNRWKHSNHRSPVKLSSEIKISEKTSMSSISPTQR